ncbi:MAG: hypothetical protein KJO11_00860 [Gemmatimonadetes bacterium]|nr:hypothetical protein [Gemmatimonadota bacterium]
MKNLLRRIRGALGMGLAWAAVGFLAGMGLELIHNIWPNPILAEVDIWPAALAYPGFVGGIAFSAVLGIAGRRRRFDELSLTRFAVWGALGGALVSLVPAAMVALGLATPNESIVRITLALLGPFSIGGAVAAAGTLALARRADDRELLAESDDVAEVGLDEAEMKELLGGR